MKLIIAFFILLIITASLSAHGLHIDVKKENKVFTVSVTYAKGHGVKNADIIISNNQNQAITRGTTNDQGSFSFLLIKPEKHIKITVDDGTGHRNIVTFNTAQNHSSSHSHNSNNIIYGGITMLITGLSIYLLISKKKS